MISAQVNEITKSIVAANPLSVKVFVTDKEREALIAPRSKGSQKKSEEFFAVRKRSLSELADRDIVIVTYNTMQAGGPYAGRGDVNPIEQIRWTRVAVRIQPVRQAGLEVLFIISAASMQHESAWRPRTRRLRLTRTNV